MKLRFKLVIATVVVICLGYFLIIKARENGFRTGYAPIQPINFSHKVHAGDNKINCQYCHFASDKSRHAGIPPTQLCLNCHKKIKPDSPEIKKLKLAIDSKKNIKWTRVHNMPDFAYFNHSQHVRVAKIDCQKCHGPVETMAVLTQTKPMNMGWCIDCHRQKEIAPPENHKSATGGDCASCHY